MLEQVGLVLFDDARNVNFEMVDFSNQMPPFISLDQSILLGIPSKLSTRPFRNRQHIDPIFLSFALIRLEHGDQLDICRTCQLTRIRHKSQTFLDRLGDNSFSQLFIILLFSLDIRIERHLRPRPLLLHSYRHLFP